MNLLLLLQAVFLKALLRNSLRKEKSFVGLKMNPFHGKEQGLKKFLLISPLFRFCVDLGENRAVIPSHYTLRYGSSGAACCPRNWLLQGSNYLPNDVCTFLSL